MVSTPCIKICTMDPRAGICAGCGRTLEEIARWGGMTESERLRIMQLLLARLEKAKQTV
jgi:predicted Fe-S protein YdhL (DUF1289 family)